MRRDYSITQFKGGQDIMNNIYVFCFSESWANVNLRTFIKGFCQTYYLID